MKSSSVTRHIIPPLNSNIHFLLRKQLNVFSFNFNVKSFPYQMILSISGDMEYYHKVSLSLIISISVYMDNKWF